MQEEMLNLVIECVEQLEDMQGITPPPDIDVSTALYGENGFLDSMALVTFIVSVEQAIDDKFGISIALADSRAMSQRQSPFRNVGSLVDYIISLQTAKA